MARQILCPMVGLFHRRATPNDPPYVTEGQVVSEDTTIGTIEVMKSFFPLKSTVSGTLTKFLVEDGEYVETDLPIAEVE